MAGTERHWGVRALGALLATCTACSFLDDLGELTAGTPDAGDSAYGGPGLIAQGGSGGTAANPAETGGSGSVGEVDAGASSGSGGAPGGSAGSSGGGSSGSAGSGTAGGGGGVVGATRIYWLERGRRTVNVANTDGTQREPLVTVPGSGGKGLASIAVDPPRGKLYFTDNARQRVQYADLDGSNAAYLLPGSDRPAGIDLDGTGGKLYFADQGAAPAVRRANVDGTSEEPLLTLGFSHPCGLALDAPRGMLYVVDDTLDAIFSLNLDGSNLTNLNIPGVSDPVEISIDTQTDKIYWSEGGTVAPRIRRAKLDGSEVEDIITPANTPGFSSPTGVEVDVPGRVLYFAFGGSSGAISSSGLDGSGVLTILGDLNDPTGLALQSP